MTERMDEHWAVWSVWRGDRAKLARIARAMEACHSPVGSVRATVTVEVLDDTECYASIDDFTDQASEQTTSSFEVLTFVADGPAGTITTKILRSSTTGVTVSVVDKAGGGWIGDPLERVRVAVTRGALQWRWARWPPFRGLLNYEPTTHRSSDGAGKTKGEALTARNRGRARAIWAWASLVLFTVALATYGLARPGWEAEWQEIVPVLGGIALLSIAIGRVPAVQDHVLPAIEVAAKTPGRRQLARATFVAGPLAALLFRHLL